MYIGLPKISVSQKTPELKVANPDASTVAIAKIIDRLMSKSPADRYGSALEVKQALADSLNPSKVDSPVKGTILGARRSVFAIAALASVCVIGAACVFMTMHQHQQQHELSLQKSSNRWLGARQRRWVRRSRRHSNSTCSCCTRSSFSAGYRSRKDPEQLC